MRLLFVGQFERQSLRNKLQYWRRVKGEHAKRNYENLSGKTSSAEFQTIETVYKVYERARRESIFRMSSSSP
jgi:hypothetical protein